MKLDKLINFFLLLLFIPFLWGYSYKNSQQKVIVSSPRDTTFVRQIYSQLNKSAKLVNYTLGRKTFKNKIFFSFIDETSALFSSSKRYITSEKELKKKNTFAIFHILNELSLRRVFYSWRSDKKVKLKIPDWLIASYSIKLYRQRLLNSYYLLISPFICQQISKGKTIEIKKLIEEEFNKGDVVLYETLSIYSELFFKFLLSLKDRETLKYALLLNNNEKFYQLYEKICLAKKKKNFQDSFNAYCFNFLSTLPYKVNLIKFKEFYANSFVIDKVGIIKILQNNKEQVNIDKWNHMLDKSFKYASIQSQPFFTKALKLIDYIREEKVYTNRGRKNIINAIRITAKKWKKDYSFYKENQTYFDSFYQSQRLEEKVYHFREQFKRTINYEEYEKYLVDFDKRRKK